MKIASLLLLLVIAATEATFVLLQEAPATPPPVADPPVVQYAATTFHAPAFQPMPQQQAGGFAYRQLAGQKFLVTGNSPGGVYFRGAINGASPSDASGNIRGVFNVPALGNVVASSGGGFLIQNGSPTIRASVSPLPGGRYLVSGTVEDDTPESAVGLLVCLTFQQALPPNLIGGPTTAVRADGTWSIFVEWPNEWRRPVVGVASVADWYGLPSAQQITLD